MIRSLLKEIKKIEVVDFWHIIMLLVSALPACILKLLKRKNIWLIVERVDRAEDNGWIFYKWLRANRPEQPVYFILDKRASNFDDSDKCLIPWGSFRHYQYYLAAKVHIKTMFLRTAPNLRVCAYFEKFFRKKMKRVYLRHGISTSGVEHHTYDLHKARLFICGAKPEYDYISQNAGYPEGYVQYTGFARFDDLVEKQRDERFVLIMPTWRRYIDLYNNTREENEERFINSTYYQHFHSLLNNTAFIDYISDSGYKVKFYMHAQFRHYLHLFKDVDSRVEILDNSVTVHELLMSTSLLITDYSSVFFDVAYMKKPMVFYQFDYEEFRKLHFSEGYFSYKRHGMGPVVETQEELMDALNCFYDGEKFINTEFYLKRCENFFPTHDNHNCERIYNAIKSIENE